MKTGGNLPCFLGVAVMLVEPARGSHHRGPGFSPVAAGRRARGGGQRRAMIFRAGLHHPGIFNPGEMKALREAAVLCGLAQRRGGNQAALLRNELHIVR